MVFISGTLVRGCRPLENSSRMSFFSTPTEYSSSMQARMATLRWLVGWLPPLTISGMMLTTVLPLCASSRSGFMPIGLRMLLSVSPYRVSQSCGRHSGSGTVSPGTKISVLSGRLALIRPCPYSKSSFIFLLLYAGLLPRLPSSIRGGLNHLYIHLSQRNK